jgi:hypothetical protein
MPPTRPGTEASIRTPSGWVKVKVLSNGAASKVPTESDPEVTTQDQNEMCAKEAQQAGQAGSSDIS